MCRSIPKSYIHQSWSIRMQIRVDFNLNLFLKREKPLLYIFTTFIGNSLIVHYLKCSPLYLYPMYLPPCSCKGCSQQTNRVYIVLPAYSILGNLVQKRNPLRILNTKYIAIRAQPGNSFTVCWPLNMCTLPKDLNKPGRPPSAMDMMLPMKLNFVEIFLSDIDSFCKSHFTILILTRIAHYCRFKYFLILI